MKMLRLLVVSAVMMTAVGALRADPLPVMVVQEVDTKNPEAYAGFIAKLNALAKARIGTEHFRHVWQGDFAGENSHKLFVVTSFPSATELYQTQEKLKNYPEMDVLLGQMSDMRTLGASSLYKCVRNEGVYEGGVVFNTGIACTDEPAYQKALDSLKETFGANGFKDLKVNLYRIISGRTNTTHLVVMSLPNPVRLGELFDALHDKGLLNEWNVMAAKIRTSIGNGTYHEITK